VKLATWNINSIRAREPRLLAWLERERPDVLCLQETKVEDPSFPGEALRRAGYEVATFGQRSYNGVAICARAPLTDVVRGMGDDAADEQARMIAASVLGLRVVCVYVPNGEDLTSEKFPYKLAWYRRLRAFLERTSRRDAELVGFGFVDLFRKHHPDGGVYSWWDYRGVAFFKNQGLRIDHIYATQAVAARCTSCRIDRDARKGQDASDHAPVIAELT